MGDVYRARDPELEREVAIKVLPAALASHPDRIARFTREAKPSAFLSTPFLEGEGVLSPDGHWLAYNSNESGRNEIYVRPFPASADRTGKYLVSSGGANFGVRWRGDGKELFYRSGRRMMAVDISTTPEFKAGAPHPLFEASFGPATRGRAWDVTRDGKRFIVSSVTDQESGGRLNVVLNWTAALR